MKLPFASGFNGPLPPTSSRSPSLLVRPPRRARIIEGSLGGGEPFSASMTTLPRTVKGGNRRSLTLSMSCPVTSIHSVARNWTAPLRTSAEKRHSPSGTAASSNVPSCLDSTDLARSSSVIAIVTFGDRQLDGAPPHLGREAPFAFRHRGKLECAILLGFHRPRAEFLRHSNRHLRRWSAIGVEQHPANRVRGDRQRLQFDIGNLAAGQHHDLRCRFRQGDA